jgi:hypothetical protein
LAQPHKDYSRSPLYRKLGINEDSLITTRSAPDGFLDLLGPLPAGATHVEDPAELIDVAILFATTEDSLRAEFEPLSRRLAPSGGLWVAWPKKASKIPNELGFDTVQEVGLGAGLVDNKSCAIDADWQAMRFVYRLRDRPGANRLR